MHKTNMSKTNYKTRTQTYNLTLTSVTSTFNNKCSIQCILQQFVNDPDVSFNGWHHLPFISVNASMLRLMQSSFTATNRPIRLGYTTPMHHGLLRSSLVPLISFCMLVRTRVLRGATILSFFFLKKWFMKWWNDLWKENKSPVCFTKQIKIRVKEEDLWIK